MKRKEVIVIFSLFSMTTIIKIFSIVALVSYNSRIKNNSIPKHSEYFNSMIAKSTNIEMQTNTPTFELIA